MDARICKTFHDSSVDILTLPVDQARAHVGTRTDRASDFGLIKITVTIDEITHTWTPDAGWSTAKAERFELIGAPASVPAGTYLGAALHRFFDTREEALAFARLRGYEAFEIREVATDLQVYVEWPKPVWH